MFESYMAHQRTQGVAAHAVAPFSFCSYLDRILYRCIPYKSLQNDRRFTDAREGVA